VPEESRDVHGSRDASWGRVACLLKAGRSVAFYGGAANPESTSGLALLGIPLSWDSPASTDTFTLRDVSFSYSILLEVGGAHVTQR
jgi:hypothetical protein